MLKKSWSLLMRPEDWDWGSKCFPEDIRVLLLFKPGEVLHNFSIVMGMHVISSGMVWSVNDYCVSDIYITSFSNIGASLNFFLHNYLCTSLCCSSYYLEGNWDGEAKQLSIILYNVELSNIFFWCHIQTNTHQAVSIFLWKRKKLPLRSDEKRSLQKKQAE